MCGNISLWAGHLIAGSLGMSGFKSDAQLKRTQWYYYDILIKTAKVQIHIHSPIGTARAAGAAATVLWGHKYGFQSSIQKLGSKYRYVLQFHGGSISIGAYVPDLPDQLCSEIPSAKKT